MKASASPLSSLNLPGRIIKLLEDNGFTNISDLASRLEEDPKSILAIDGIGSKTLLSIGSAFEALESDPAEEYREPVQSLGDQFKSVPPAASETTEKKVKVDKKAKKDKKKTDKKPKKAGKKKDKKPEKKASKKKEKESKMADKKKDKKPKKSDDKKDKKKDKKPGKKKK